MAVKKIVIATDFSKHAQYALARAIQIATYFKAELTCLHVINHSWLDYFTFSEFFEQEMVMNESLKETELSYTKALQKFSNEYPINVVTLTGKVSDKISDYIKNNDIDLVLMGAHGHYYLNDYILGSHSESLIKQVSIPVQLIKKEPDFSYQRILVAVDFSDTSKKAVEMAFKLYPEAEFLMLHVADVWYEKHVREKITHQQLNEEMAQVLQKKLTVFLAKCEVNHSQFVAKFIGGYPTNDIAAYAVTWGAQLVVMGTRGHSALHYMLVGSVTNRLLRINNTDMLLVPPNR